MITLDLGLIATLAGLAGSLGALGALVYRLFRRLDAMERSAKESRNDIHVIYRALFACLDGLNQLGCNGEVCKAKGDMRKHLIDE